MEPLLVTFAGGAEGLWSVEESTAIRGEGLPAAERLVVLEGLRETEEWDYVPREVDVRLARGG